MAIRLLTDAVFQDEDGDLTISGDGLRVDFDTITSGSKAYVSFDDGAGFYPTTPDKNIDVEFETQWSSADNGTIMVPWMLADKLGGHFPLQTDGTVNVISLRGNRTSGGTFRYLIREWVDGVGQAAFVAQNFSLLTQLFHKLTINWTTGILSWRGYLNSARTNPAFALQTYSLSKDRALQYHSALASEDFTGSNIQTGHFRDFNQISPALPGASMGVPPAIFQAGVL